MEFGIQHWVLARLHGNCERADARDSYDYGFLCVFAVFELHSVDVDGGDLRGKRCGENEEKLLYHNSFLISGGPD